MYKIVNGKYYSANVTLNWIQSMATNEQVAEYFIGLSFEDVVVEGGGDYRSIRGRWNGPTQEFDLPEEISNFKEITEET